MGYLVLNKATGANITLAGTFPFIAVTKAEQKQELLGVETFTTTVESKNPINFEIGDSLVAFGRRYWINSPQNITVADLGDKYVYDLQFEGIQYRFLNAVLFDMGISQYATGTSVVYTANLLEVLRLIVTCANFNEGSDVFTLDEANVPQTKRMTLTFNDTNCLAALQTVCGKDFFNMLFKFVEQAGGTYKLRVGVTVGENQPYRFKVGQQGGTYDIKRSKGSNSGATFTRLFAFGSSENIATAYRGFSPKLRLPATAPAGFVMPTGLELVNDTTRNLNYIQLSGAAQHVSFVKTYTDIKPHRTGKVTAIDGTSIYKFYDTAMDFNLNARLDNGETIYLLNGQAAKIHFNSGKLAGLEFDATYNNESKSFVLVAYSDDKSQTFPDPKTTAFRVAIDDEYVILNINMPTSYIEAAEKELLTSACKDLNDSFSPENKFTIRVRELYLKKFESPGVESNFFNVGDFVHVNDATMALDKEIQILSFTRNWLQPYSYTLELSDVITISYVVQMLGKIENLTNLVVTNKLDNPARTKRNWRVSEELAGMVNSVRTDMLLVGNPEGQYDTSIAFEFNYGGNRNRVLSSAGILVHSVYSDGIQAGTWHVGSSDSTLTDADLAKFIYIRATIADDTASIVYSDTKIGVESVNGFYHFPYCVLSSIMDGFRTATLLKGSTQIIGDAIRTGHIKGNKLDIDLNAGTIQGKIKYLSADNTVKDIDTEVGTAASAATNAASAAANAASAAATAADAATATGANSASAAAAATAAATAAANAAAAAAAAKLISDAVNNNFTSIEGGLILTTLIEMLSVGVISAGMAAKTVANNVAFWGGGTLAQAQTKDTNFGVTHGGDVWLKGMIEALTGKIGGFDIKNETLSALDKQSGEGVVFSNDLIPGLPFLDNGYAISKPIYQLPGSTINFQETIALIAGQAGTERILETSVFEFATNGAAKISIPMHVESTSINRNHCDLEFEFSIESLNGAMFDTDVTKYQNSGSVFNTDYVFLCSTNNTVPTTFQFKAKLKFKVNRQYDIKRTLNTSDYNCIVTLGTATAHDYTVITKPNQSYFGIDGLFILQKFSNYLRVSSSAQSPYLFDLNGGMKAIGAKAFFNESQNWTVDDQQPEPIISSINSHTSFLLSLAYSDTTTRAVHLPNISELPVGVTDFTLKILVVMTYGGVIAVTSKTGATMYDADGFEIADLAMAVGDSIELQACKYSNYMRYYLTRRTGG